MHLLRFTFCLVWSSRRDRNWLWGNKHWRVQFQSSAAGNYNRIDAPFRRIRNRLFHDAGRYRGAPRLTPGASARALCRGGLTLSTVGLLLRHAHGSRHIQLYGQDHGRSSAGRYSLHADHSHSDGVDDHYYGLAEWPIERAIYLDTHRCRGNPPYAWSLRESVAACGFIPERIDWRDHEHTTQTVSGSTLTFEVTDSTALTHK